jgi:RNA polymerase sigma-70 factor (ECF subfamily)
MSANASTVPFSGSFEIAPGRPATDGRADDGHPGRAPRPRRAVDSADDQSGDLAARMYEQHHAELYRSALRASRDPGTAEDLVQDAFLRLMLEIGRNRTPDNIRAWLYRVIANLAVSLGRRTTVRQRFAGALGSDDEPPTPEAIAIDDELRAELASALGALPDQARTALLLAANGYSGAEIAAAIGRTDCATRTLMCRARLELRERLVAGATGPRTTAGAAGLTYALGSRGSAGLTHPVSAALQ